ncbi:unnamed protein product [Rotaria sp. Silwood1]|nr:unnamed protein product [Rotaria sp. Silwood1]
MGGLINTYTFINQTTHSQYNYSKTLQDISHTVSSENRSRTNLSLSEDSQTFIFYEPSIKSNGSKSDWFTWIHALDKRPSVINRTLIYLTYLLDDYPEVQNHLQKTIDYYQKHGVLPTLAQLNGKKNFKLSSTHLPSIYGLDIVGCGFDILSMQSKLCLIDISKMNDENQYIDPFNRSLIYSVPIGFYAIDTPDSLTLNFSIQLRTIDDYYKRTFYSTHSDSFGFLGFGASHNYKSIETFYRRFYEENYYLALRLLQIKWYTLSMITFPYPKLNSIAQNAIEKLPNTFNSNNTIKFNQFFSTFGTHFVQSADMGGLLQSELWYKKCLLYTKSETWIKEESNKFWWFFSSSQSSSSYQSSIDQQFKEYSMFSSKLIGGNQFMNTTLWEQWAPTVKSNPKAVQYYLRPIYTLLPVGQQRTALADALAYLRTNADTNAKEYISQLKELNPPPQRDCGLNKKKRHLRLEKSQRQKRSLALNANAARQALCPIVGYNGSFCPGTNKNVKSTARVMKTITQLHRGVGMTIDISTGKLMLPVLELTYPSKLKIWKDEKGSGRSFSIPNEISLTPVDVNRDNKPTSYIYPTPMQLADVWTRASGSGSWLGGELGHTKSVLDINLKFFSKQQATAITQQPIGLYRLEVNNLTLNEYVKEAISLLPATYDASIYSDFMDTWGTHIAVSTLIGGMVEQQVVFKKCMLSMLALIGNNILDSYLTADLTSNKTTNSLYTQRRQLTLNHRLGGNPTINDHSTWIRTIASNPALLKIDRYIPWWDVLTDTKIKQNMQKAIADRLDQVAKNQNQLESQNQNSLGLETIDVSVGFTLPRIVWDGFIPRQDGQMCLTVGPILLNTSSLCNNECNLGQFIVTNETLTGFENLFTYKRDNTTGSFHIVFNDYKNSKVVVGSEVYGAGCSAIEPNNNNNNMRIFPVLELPGLNYLASGFDAARMVNLNEVSSSDQSKFRLFDLGASNGKTYTLTVVTLELSIDNTIQEAYQMMQSKYTAVATSTTWWGMYSIQMLPAYMLKFSSIFNRSLSRLVSNPTTEQQQLFYNQIVTTFGTHYVSSVIVGGIAHYYTFLTEEWQRQNSQSSTENQVSIGFHLGFDIPLGIGEDFGGISFGGGWGFSGGVQLETFKKNSATKFLFRPAPVDLSSTLYNHTWIAWASQTARQPVVVNRTLIPLSNLLLDFPIGIAEHLQSTIDFYLRTGRLPKLTDVVRKERQSLISSMSISGLDVVGCGYDIIELQSKQCLFDMTYNQNKLWSNVFNGHRSYRIPDGYSVTGIREFNSTYNTHIFDSYDKFIENSIYMNEQDTEKFLGFGMSYERKDIVTRLQNIYKYHLKLAWTNRKVLWYNLSIVNLTIPPLNSVAKMALNDLPSVFKKEDFQKVWKTFFDTYGTHYVTSAEFGGMIWAEDYFNQCLITKNSIQWIKDQIKRSYWFISTSEFNSLYVPVINQDYLQYRISTMYVIGGDNNLNSFQFKKWMQSIKDKPNAITYSLLPIYTLLPLNTQKRKALEEATLYIRLQAVNMTNAYLNNLQSVDWSIPSIKCFSP